MPQKLTVNGKSFRVIKMLGKGKGGYSYLVTDGAKKYVVKQIHHEPCNYYTFGNKIQSEIDDYKKLLEAGIDLPEMYDADLDNERILKEYIEGDTADELISKKSLSVEYIKQIEKMSKKVYLANLNIDYYPTNFVLRNGKMIYIDYECNTYSDEWNFENWGKKYWLV